MVHLVYCDNTGKQGLKELDLIAAGKKTAVIRAAAGRKIPHSRVFQDEVLYFMEKGTKDIHLEAKVSKVSNFTKLEPDEIIATLNDFQDMLQLTEKQQKRWSKKCMCIIEFKEVKVIEPLMFEHQGNMDDWLIIENIEDVLVGTSIPHDYSKSKLK